MNQEKVMETRTKTWDEAFESEIWIAPTVNIYETGESFFLEARMPGVSKDNVKIKLEEGNLIVMGRIDYNAFTNRKYILKESETANYYRKLKISDNIDDTNIDASLAEGLLKVKLPKSSGLKARNIEIE